MSVCSLSSVYVCAFIFISLGLGLFVVVVFFFLRNNLHFHGYVGKENNICQINMKVHFIH